MDFGLVFEVVDLAKRTEGRGVVGISKTNTCTVFGLEIYYSILVVILFLTVCSEVKF